MTKFNKLVRDRIPEIITENGKIPITRILTDEEYRRELLNKIVEEAIELRDSDGNIWERADLEQATQAYDAIANLSRKAIENARAQKAAERGGFDKKIFLERTEERE